MKRIRNLWDSRRRGCVPVLAKNNTIKHEKGHPTDDRPEYLTLGDTPYTIALDTETTGLDWFDGDFPFVATISDYDRDYLYRMCQGATTTPDEAIADIEKLRRDILNADRIIFHNAPFDIHVLASAGVVTLEEILAKEIHDTDLLARCVLGAANGPFGLKHLATVLVDGNAGEAEADMEAAMVTLGLIKKVGQKSKPPGAYHTAWLSYPDLVEKYALLDTRYTYDLFHVLMERASEADLQVYELERSVQPTIIRMEHKGTRLDELKVDALKARYERIAEETQEELFALNGYEELNLNSNAEVADFLIEQGVPLNKLTDTGQIRVDKWALEPFEDHPAVDLVQRHNNATKFLSTYIAPMLDRDKVHTSFWQIGARTGRMSSSRPNLQNIPVRSGPEMREVFIPRDGYVFLDADYSSIELRILAYYMNDPQFWHIIEAGDPFMWIGEQVYGTADQEQWRVGRQALKNGTYALTYGAGGPKLASTIGGGMTAEEGRDLAKKIKGALGPAYYQLNKTIQGQVRRQGYIRTLGRRTQHVDPDKSYVGLNALIQGTAADVMKQGLANAAAALEPFDAYPLLVIHDEILAECPAEHGDTALEALKQAMVEATDKFVLKVDGKVCVNSFAEGK